MALCRIVQFLPRGRGRRGHCQGWGAWGGQGWAREAALGAPPPMCCGDWPRGRRLTQQLGQEAGLSAGATYIGEACDEQDGMSKSSNDEGTALLQHCPLPHCTAPALQRDAG